MNYQSATGLRCFEFSLGFVFAPDPETAERIATENGMWGAEASEAHLQLTRDMIAAFRNLAREQHNEAARRALSGEVTRDA